MGSNSTVLAFGCDEPYWLKAQDCLNSVANYGDGFDRRYFFHVGWNPYEWYKHLNSVRPVHLPAAFAVDTFRGNAQQGHFLRFIPKSIAASNPVIVFTDMDVIMQRGLSEWESTLLAGWTEGVVGLSYNARHDDSLMNEAYRLELRVDTENRLLQKFPYARMKVYNVGVVVARMSTYWRIFKRCQELWRTFLDVRPPNQLRGVQFVMCNAIHSLGLRVWEMPVSWHSHGHAGSPPVGTGFDRGVLKDITSGETVLFRHAV